MKTPAFWRKRNWKTELLAPFSVLYFFAVCLRHVFGKPTTVDAPVICVANAIAGGSGKTPVCAALADLLTRQKKKPAILRKTYRATITEPTQVNPKSHTAAEVGDESLELSHQHAVFVGGNRVKTAQCAIEKKHNILILDDGLQDPSLHKDFTLLVIDGLIGFGNRLLIPAGPLRDRADLIFSRSDAILMIGPDTEGVLDYYRPVMPATLPVFHAKTVPDAKIIRSLGNKPIMAFAGIGYPEKFFTMLRAHGLQVERTDAFPDHHMYSEKECETLVKDAKAMHATLVTTAKDATKIPARFLKHITVIPISIALDDPKGLLTLVKKAGKDRG